METSLQARQTLFICMGSACHQAGVMQVLPHLQELIQEYNLQERVELKGAFCLGGCGHGIVLKLGDHEIFDVSTKNLKRKFALELLPLIQGVPEV